MAEKMRFQIDLDERSFDMLADINIDLVSQDTCECVLEPSGTKLRLPAGSCKLKVTLVRQLFVDVLADGVTIASHILAPMFFEAKGFFLEHPEGVRFVSGWIMLESGEVVPDSLQVLGADCIAGNSSVDIMMIDSRCAFKLEVVKESQVTLELGNMSETGSWSWAGAAVSFLSSPEPGTDGGFCTVYCDALSMSGEASKEDRCKVGFFKYKRNRPTLIEVAVKDLREEGHVVTVDVFSRDESKKLRDFPCRLSGPAMHARVRETYYQTCPGVHKVEDVGSSLIGV